MVTFAILLCVISMMPLASLKGFSFVRGVLSFVDLAIRYFGQLVIVCVKKFRISFD